MDDLISLLKYYDKMIGKTGNVSIEINASGNGLIKLESNIGEQTSYIKFMNPIEAHSIFIRLIG